MPEQERPFETSNVMLCPYWRRFVIRDSGNSKLTSILALCGRASPDEPRSTDPDQMLRASTCPIKNSASTAFDNPVIYEIIKSRLLRPIIGTNRAEFVIKESQSSGSEGIQELEAAWEEEVELFRQRSRKKQDIILNGSDPSSLIYDNLESDEESES
jgi:hypothetical protein